MSERVLIALDADLVSQPALISELKARFEGYDVHQQLLERIDQDAVRLPSNKFSKIYVAAGEVTQTAADAFYKALQAAGTLSGSMSPSSKTNLLVSGFILGADDEWTKLASGNAKTVVQLKRPLSTRGKSVLLRRKDAVEPLTPPQEVAGSMEDIIDENDLLNEDLPMLKLPAKCDPGNGKRRKRACKDCTCGLKEEEESELEKRSAERKAVLLGEDELAEIDFTVPGKAVGGCGSCALGDAFRCDGCPYLGLPPFKPGEVVSIDQMGDDF